MKKTGVRIKRKSIPILLLVLILAATGCGNQGSSGSNGSATGSSTTDSSAAGSSTAGSSTAGSSAVTGSGKEDGGSSGSSTDNSEAANGNGTDAASMSGITSVIDATDIFSGRDFEVGYDEKESTAIRLDGSYAACSSDSVSVSGSTVTITEEGTYILSGTLEDGMVIIDTDKSEKVQLILNQASIHSQTSAPIYVRQADKVYITLADGSTNTLSNGGSFTAIDENNIDAAIFSKEDLTLNGSGTLIVTSPAGHGIVSKDSLKFTSGSYDISCASHAISGKDDICIANADFAIVSGKDGIHAENTDDAALGFVYIQSGTFRISAEGDGISASSCTQIEDGSFDITSGGGSANAAAHSSDNWGGFLGGGRHGGMMGGGRGGMGAGDAGAGGLGAGDTGTDSIGAGDVPNADDMPGAKDAGDMRGGKMNGEAGVYGMPGGDNGMPYDKGSMPGRKDGSPDGEGDIPDGDGSSPDGDGSIPAESTDDSDESTSMKGIKAVVALAVNGGTFCINSADDSFHSNGALTIAGGSFEIASGDDAFHADDTLTVFAGTINITESYEGLEGLHVNISGGDITLTASDDGINAAGGTDASGSMGGRDEMFGHQTPSASDGSITISGGNIQITAYGDGIDANGSLEITDGAVTVCGPTQGDTATLDYDTSGVILGGTFIGTGGAGMAQTFSDSGQGVITVNAGNQSAGTSICLSDSEGNVLITHTPALDFAVVILSSPAIVSGEAYTVTIGSSSGELTAK